MDWLVGLLIATTTFGCSPTEPALPQHLRNEYELELFSEIQMWDRPSSRYPNPEGPQEREIRWRKMAGDGFELAATALEVLEPRTGTVRASEGALRKLQGLAAQGNVGAMCFMPGLLAVSSSDVSPYRAQLRHWLELGVDAGHAQCKTELGRRLLNGAPGFERDIARGLELEFAAKRAGYAHDYGALILYFEKFTKTDAQATRLYCWLSAEEATWAPHASRHQTARFRELLRVANRATLAEELQRKSLTLQDCLEMGHGDSR